MTRFLHRPQTVGARRLLFQVHLWTGVIAGLYIFVACVTGAALLFRIDMQRAEFPDLFRPKVDGARADATTLLESVQRAYPDHRVSGIDAPTTARPTVLAYVSRDGRFRTVLADPSDGQVLGELPDESLTGVLQDLHFDLLGGRTGRIVNGIGAFVLLAMCATGLVIWWPGIATWRRALTIDPRRGWRRINFDLHSAVGFWTAAFIAMWAVTGIYFAFPSQFRSAVNRLSPLTIERTPTSDVAMRDRQPRPSWRALIARAEREVPGLAVARVVVPASDHAPFHVLFAESIPMPVGATDLVSVYLDQYTGAVLSPPPDQGRSVGDMIMAWVAPLHVGSFGGAPVKALWLVLALAPPLLFVTGLIMWWNRALVGRVPRSGPAARRVTIST